MYAVMPELLWVDNDRGPFKSSSYTLVFGGPGRKSVEIDIGDRDIVLCVSVDETATRLLHLQNVREGTVEEAKAAIKQANLLELAKTCLSLPPRTLFLSALLRVLSTLT